MEKCRIVWVSFYSLDPLAPCNWFPKLISRVRFEDVEVWLGWDLWHINHCRLFNAKIYFLYIKTVIFQTIQFSISTQFLFYLTHRLDIRCYHSRSEWTWKWWQWSISGASPSDCVMSYLGHSLGASYPSLEKQLVYSIAPTD